MYKLKRGRTITKLISRFMEIKMVDELNNTNIITCWSQLGYKRIHFKYVRTKLNQKMLGSNWVNLLGNGASLTLIETKSNQ